MQKPFLYLSSFAIIALGVSMQIDLITALTNLMLKPSQSRGLILFWMITFFESEVNAWYLIDHAFLFLGLSLGLLALGVLLLVMATRTSRTSNRTRRYSF